MMKKLFIHILVIALLQFCGCAGKADNKIMQTSTINALLAGVYDGYLSIGSLLQYGDFGIGTFDRLDGEMIVLDGNVYQVRADGKVYAPSDDMMTPFATVCLFRPEISFSLQQEAHYDGFKSIIDEKISNHNLLYAIQIEGLFSQMKVRSVPVQQKPYQPLSKVAKSQKVFHLNDVYGTIVGFRLPSFLKGINVTGYHLHFISDDKEQGGHILDFKMASGIVEIDQMNQFFLILPDANLQKIDLSRDREEELKTIEQ
jgi:acetolactate decarboxylase